MASSIKELNSKSSLQNEFIWEYKRNIDPWDATQTAKWTPYSNAISSDIEEAYKRGFKQVFVGENYLIDLKHYVEEHINNPHQQRPVRRRRCRLPSSIVIEEETENESSRRERFSSPLGLVLSRSATENTAYYGSPFIHIWLVIFTKGKMKVIFDTIFPALVKGLIEEGQSDTKNKVHEIEAALNKVEKDTREKSSKKRIKELQNCCAKLYTKACYVYRVVNAALRNDDRTKLHTIGPFCYLLFNYIGQRFKDNSSIRDHLRRVLRPNEIQSMTLYRGDRSSDSTIEEYQRAAGDCSKHFKWLPFVSTSYDRAAAENFAVDVLYIIEIQSYSSNEDQFTDLTTIGHYADEKEILLLPGVQFQVNKLEFDNEKGLHLVYIKINSSYVSRLK
ncbi:unnamed protein product [Rotaria sp. Silwood2]|nr:unnamed protein product [Rotaria sp. Silwood2]CAF4524783.1 unnamed protein product [Rotaria sp. Silwood2]